MKFHRLYLALFIAVFSLFIFAPHAHADNPYLSDIRWGFDKNEVLYLTAHVDQSLSNAQVSLTVGATTITSAVYGLDAGRIWYVPFGQNIFAGQDMTFYFPYCTTCLWFDSGVSNHTRESLIDRLGLVVSPGDTGHISIGGSQDNADYPATFWTGLKDWNSISSTTQKEHEVNFSLLYGNYLGYDKIRVLVHEQFSNATTTQDFTISNNIRTTFSDHLTLPNGLYTVHPVLWNSQTGDITESDIFTSFAVNDSREPPPHYHNPYLSNVEWGFDNNETLYFKAHVDKSLNNARVGLTVGSTTITSAAYGLDAARIWYVPFGQDIFAGQDMTFYFPYCDPCAWFNARISNHTRESLVDRLGLTISPRDTGHISIGGWQDNTNYPVTGIAKEPVIIVPGIMGTRLNRVSDGEEVWPNVNLMKNPGTDSYLDELILPTHNSTLIRATEAISTATTSFLGLTIERIYLRNILGEFRHMGYEDGINLFTFPYDWRLDVRDSVNTLSDVIQSVVSNSPTGKVNLITHSLGGLVAKNYIKQFGGTAIDKLILVGVPQLGAPQSFKVLNYGDNMDFDFLGFDILNPNKVKEITQNMLAVYQLLPSREYIDLNGGYVKDFRKGVNILDYDQTNQFVLSNASDSRNSYLLDLADGFHQGLDQQIINNVRVYNILGCRNIKTITGFRVYENGKYDIDLGDGDGTVPLVSALALSPNTNATDYFVLFNKTGANHTGLVRENAPLTLIKNVIEDQLLTLPFGVSTSSTDCFRESEPPPINETTIVFSTHSPVELHVYDSQNRHIGPIASGDIELGIHDSNYERIGENSFAFVPEGDTYRVVIDALSSGSFDLKTRIFNGSVLDETITYLAVFLGSSSTIAELTFSDPREDLRLKLDNDGDGSVDNFLQPTAVLSQVESRDITPPELAIVSPQSKDYVSSESLILLINASDTESGVAFVKARFDDRIINSTTTIDLFFEHLGNHMLSVNTSDRAGNPASKEVSLRIIATPESIISDINRAFSLGWINNRGVKESFVSKAKQGLWSPLLSELNAQHGRHVNESAYQLLQENVNWILGN